nr:tyrosine-type recombinase/integrase [Robbsia betulipollinis]
MYQNTSGYYWFRHPVTGKTYGLGRDLKEASLQVKSVNAELALRDVKPTLLARIQTKNQTVKAWVDEYMAPIREKYAGQRYLKNVETEIGIIVAEIGEMFVAAVEPFDIVQLVKKSAERGPSLPPKIRSHAMRIFREAINHGLLKPGQNPVDSTFAPKAKVTRERLSLETFLAVRAQAAAVPELCWFVNAMNLALISGQRVGDIAGLQRSHVREGFLWIEQQKTSARLKIPLGLRMAAIDMSIEDVVRHCNDNVLSKHLIHLVKSYASARAGQPPSVNTFAHTFRKMLIRIEYAPEAGKTATVFHEIRSLSARLYTEVYGKEFAQAVMGHKTSRMTDLYRDSRGSEWVIIKASA